MKQESHGLRGSSLKVSRVVKRHRVARFRRTRDRKICPRVSPPTRLEATTTAKRDGIYYPWSSKDRTNGRKGRERFGDRPMITKPKANERGTETQNRWETTFANSIPESNRPLAPQPHSPASPIAPQTPFEKKPAPRANTSRPLD